MTNLPRTPLPGLPFFPKKKNLPVIFLENEPLVRETNFTLGPIQKPLYFQFFFAHYTPKSVISWALGPIHYITLKALGMGSSVKHVLGDLEWSYVVPEKPFF